MADFSGRGGSMPIANPGEPAGAAAQAPPTKTSAATMDPVAVAETLAQLARRRPIDLIAAAKLQLQELTGYPVDSVANFSKTEEGWQLLVAVVELRRIPPTTDVMAEYVVHLDESGSIVDFRRQGRYLRNQVGDSE